jgi:hypothetical protein
MHIDATPEDARNALRALEKTIVTFAGFSGLGYEDEAVLLEALGSVLAEFDPKRTVVNAGGTADGVGAIYPLAVRLGFDTTGVVSAVSREQGAEFSPSVDRVFVIPDDTWGGFLEGTDRLSPTSRTMVDVSDVYVAIGGGSITRDEMKVARAEGKDVRFYPADMNHERAIERAARKGAALPTDFRGEAHTLFEGF